MSSACVHTRPMPSKVSGTHPSDGSAGYGAWVREMVTLTAIQGFDVWLTLRGSPEVLICGPLRVAEILGRKRLSGNGTT